MIVPSIDLMNGSAVQLREGRDLVIDAGDPRPIAARFGRVGEIAVIDLDAALGRGDNAAVIEELLTVARCRVGGGIRSVDAAVRWLDRGAASVILGTAATPEVLRELPRGRVIAALDARDDEVVVEGWTRDTGLGVHDRVRELRPYVGGFLVTFVENEGHMRGFDEARVRALVEAAEGVPITVAGGVRDAGDIAMADRAGADAQVGMALYSGAIDLAEAFTAPLRTDRPDGLWPTVVCDEHDRALGLVYSSLESVRAALDSGEGVYHSRSRGGLWRKGESSGHTQALLGVTTDCDRDALRFTVRQAGPFCHTGTEGCFGRARGLAHTERVIRDRLRDAPPGSYTRRLLDDAALLKSKLIEEAGELIDARTPGEAAWELADVIYFALVTAAQRGSTLADAARELDRRALRVTRRPGDAKTGENA